MNKILYKILELILKCQKGNVIIQLKITASDVSAKARDLMQCPAEVLRGDSAQRQGLWTKIFLAMTKKFFLSVSLFSLIFLLLASLGGAEGLITADLLEKAKAYYDKGEYTQAVHEFSRVLLVDPYNKEAKVYLNQLGLSEGLYGRQTPPLQQVTEMGQEIVGYQGQVTALAEESARQSQRSQQLQGELGNIEAALQEKFAEADQIRQEAAETKRMAAEQVAQSEKVALDMRAKANFKEKEVVRLHTDLYEMKSRFLEHQQQIEQKEATLKKIQEQIRQQLGQSNKSSREERMKYQKQEIALKAELETLRHQAMVMESENKKRMEGMREELAQKTNETDILHDRLVVANYKLANAENAIVDKERVVLEGQDVLSQMRAKVIFLENKVKGIALGQQKVSSSEVRTVDFIKKQDQQIADLKAQLLATKSQLNDLRQVGDQASMEETAGLKKQLEEMSDQWKQSKSLYESKNEDYQLLEKRLKDLQERLSVVEGQLKSRDEQMKILENQLNDDLLKMDQGR